MTHNFEYLGYRIEVFFNERMSNYYIYKDGQFLEKGKEYKDNRFKANGLMVDAEEAVDALIIKETVKRRLGKFHRAFRDIR